MFNFIKDNRGQLLLEILIAVGVAAAVLSIVSQLVLVSLNSNKAAVESALAENLAQAELRAVSAIAFSKWQDIYNLTKAPANHFFASSTEGFWLVQSGDETINLNGLMFIRYFTVDNVCRDNTNKAIIIRDDYGACTAGNSDDPSTQKIIVTISWSGGSISRKDYLTRWRNQTCVQTSWDALSSGTTTCPTTFYDNKNKIDTSIPGSIKLQAN